MNWNLALSRRKRKGFHSIVKSAETAKKLQVVRSKVQTYTDGITAA